MAKLMVALRIAGARLRVALRAKLRVALRLGEAGLRVALRFGGG